MWNSPALLTQAAHHPILGARPLLPVTTATYRVFCTEWLLWVRYCGCRQLLSGQSHDDADVAEQLHLGGLHAAAAGLGGCKLEPRKFNESPLLLNSLPLADAPGLVHALGDPCTGEPQDSHEQNGIQA